MSKKIITHKGQFSAEQITAIVLILMNETVSIIRKDESELTQEEINDPDTYCVAIGKESNFELNNYVGISDLLVENLAIAEKFYSQETELLETIQNQILAPINKVQLGEIKTAPFNYVYIVLDLNYCEGGFDDAINLGLITLKTLISSVRKFIKGCKDWDELGHYDVNTVINPEGIDIYKWSYFAQKSNILLMIKKNVKTNRWEVWQSWEDIIIADFEYYIDAIKKAREYVNNYYIKGTKTRKVPKSISKNLNNINKN